MGICNNTSNTNKKHNSNVDLQTTNLDKGGIPEKDSKGLSGEKPCEKRPSSKMAIDSMVVVSKGERNPEEIYNKIKVLGEGSFGVVWLVKHKDLDRPLAMKILKKLGSKDDELSVQREINILRELDHPNILKILEFYSTNNSYYLVTEYLPEGELFNEILDHAPFAEGPASFMMYQIFLAVAYCHGKNIIHRDLKPENILIEKRDKRGYHRIKIIDFGTAKIFERGRAERKMIGSSYYMAPEVLRKNYNEQCDMWSCGVIMYILLTGRPPFGGDTDKEIMKKIEIGKYDMTACPWGACSKQSKDLINSLLVMDPKLRLTAEAALTHPWFEMKSLQTKDMLNKLDENTVKRLIKNLTSYRSDNILRSAVLAYLVHNNTQLEQAHEAIKLFNTIDRNGDGKIMKEELLSGLKKYITDSTLSLKDEVNKIFSNIDTDNSGSIEYEEFVRAAIDKGPFLKNEFLRYAFNYFDKDLSGCITPDELKKVFFQSEKNKNDPNAEMQLKKVFEEVDVNGDGTISFEEFCTMMKNIIESS